MWTPPSLPHARLSPHGAASLATRALNMVKYSIQGLELQKAALEAMQPRKQEKSDG